jgi:hypothetical protein
MTEKEAKKQAELDRQETVTVGVSMCDVCLELDSTAVRLTNNLNYMKPTTNICKGCLRRLLEKCDKTPAK